MADRTLLDYWLILYRRRWIILTIALSAMVTAWVLSTRMDPIYEAVAVFFVPKESDKTTFFAAPSGTMVRAPLFPEAAEEPHAPYIGILKSWAIPKLVHEEFPNKPIEEIRKDMDWLLTDQFMILVFARDKNPEVAAGIANAYVKYFNQLLGQYSLPAQGQTLDTIEGEIAVNEERLTEATRALERFQLENKTANLEEEAKQLITMRTNFESLLETARIQLNETMKKIVATQRESERERGFLRASELVVTSPLLETLKSKLVDIEAQMAAARVDLKESHPQFLALKRNYEEIHRNIAQEVEKVINSQVQAPDTFYEGLRRRLVDLFVDRERLGATIASHRNVVADIESRIVEIPKLRTRLTKLSVEMDRYKSRGEILRLNSEEIKVQTKRSPQVAVVVDPATPPTKPIFPKPILNLIVALFVGLGGGLFYAFFVDYLEGTREKRIYKLLKAIETSEV